MKRKIHTTLWEQLQNPIKKIEEKCKIGTPSVQIHDYSLSFVRRGS